MTVARRLEGRLRYWKLLVTFGRQLDLKFMIFKTITTKYPWYFQNVVCLFCTFNILHISGNFESTKKADHIFEITGFTSEIRLTKKCIIFQIISNQRRHSSHLVKVMFCGPWDTLYVQNYWPHHFSCIIVL